MERLLCIVDSMNTGGAETFLMKLYRALDKVHYQMDFIVSDHGYYDDEIVSMGGRVHLIPMRTKNFIGAMNSIKCIVKHNKYTHVLKLGSTPIVVFDLLAAKAGGAKILAVRSCNAYAEESLIYRLANIIFRPLFLRLTDVMIAPSDLAAEFTFGKKSVDKGKVHFLHNAIDLEIYKYDENIRGQYIEEFNTAGKCVYGHIGRFSSQKNHAFLIDVFKEICINQPNSILLLVGSGELETEIRMKVKNLNLEDKVLFLGVRKDIPQLLSLMDVFVFPSLYEGMPNTVVEAQATGLHCIISDSITKQANFTGLVKYVSLTENAKKWASECINSKKDRINTHDIFVKNRYIINDVVVDFINCIYGGDNNE